MASPEIFRRGGFAPSVLLNLEVESIEEGRGGAKKPTLGGGRGGGSDEERCCDFFWKKVAFSLTERKKIFHFR